MGFAFFILKTPVGQPFFDFFDRAIRQVLEFADQGARFVFKSFASGEMEAPSGQYCILLSPADVDIFFRKVMSALYHLGVMQWVIGWIAKLMQKTLKTSGAETLSVAADIFIGQTEATAVDPSVFGRYDSFRIDGSDDRRFCYDCPGGVMAVYVAMLAQYTRHCRAFDGGVNYERARRFSDRQDDLP